MIIHNSKSVNKNKGSSALLRAYGWVGQAQLILFLLSFFQSAPPPKFFRAKPKQAGKKKRGSGGNEFLPACSVRRRRTGGGKRLVSALAEKKSQKKLFPFKRIFCARPLKNVSIFSGFACSAFGGVSRWAGYAPVRAQSSVQKRFALRSVNATIQDFLNFLTQRIARSPRLRRVSLRILPYISGLNQKAGEARKGFFCPAFGGSWRRSRQSKNISLKEKLKCFCFPIFSVCRSAALQSKFLNPVLFPPTAGWPKATIINLTEQTL